MSDWQWLVTLFTGADDQFQGMGEGQNVCIPYVMTVTTSQGVVWFASGFGIFDPGSRREIVKGGYPPIEIPYYLPSLLWGYIDNAEQNPSGPEDEFKPDFVSVFDGAAIGWPNPFQGSTFTMYFGGGPLPFNPTDAPSISCSGWAGGPAVSLTDVSTGVEGVLSGVGPVPSDPTSTGSALYVVWFGQPVMLPVGEYPNY